MDFQHIVTNMLCPTSKEVILTGRKLSTMTPGDAKRVRSEILHLVYGTKELLLFTGCILWFQIIIKILRSKQMNCLGYDLQYHMYCVPVHPLKAIKKILTV